ncbi:glycoside hydrolase domain-containing protein [Terrabacter carboxydivorans]|uniref:Fibronectin type-III domain-containing protein n=1 Tax=Terrabacter carboxydivorans TaxID=619730 RepID=A0ABP5ZNL2_9MICO
MTTSWCRITALVGAAALGLGGASSAAAGSLAAAPAGPGPVVSATPSAPTAPSAPSAAAPAPAAPGAPGAPAAPVGTRPVDYRGVHVTVPADWKVVDLDADPTRCLRLDVKAVYLGRPGSQQDCPAHLVGRTDTLWLHPGSDRATAASTATTASASRVGRLTAHTGSDPVARTKVARFTAQDVQVDATWGSRESTVDDVLATATTSTTTASTPAPAPAPAPAPKTPSATTTSSSATTGASFAPAVATSGSPAIAPAVATTGSQALAPTVTTAAASGPRTFTGMGFDACAAPSASTMQSWLSSPYRAAGIYIGGSMRACPDGNLSASWVSQVSSMGWGLIPIYVGAQAPCVNQTGLATIDPSQAAAQGKAAAADAAGRAATFGLGTGSPIYYDMEAYAPSASCTSTVLKFITAWTQELHARGYTSGAYGSTSSLMVDMSNAVGTSGFTAPDNVWFANWNGLQTLSDSARYREFPDGYWANGQRLHQYSTGSETWGGVNISIDANWVDGRVTGNPVPISYGTGIVGPGGPSFLFTGNMYYWKPNQGQGLQGRAYYTYTTYSSNGSVEENGATWSPSLSTGLYAVSAYVPATGATANTRYAVTDSNGTTTRYLDQSTLSGWSSLGTYLARNGSSVGVHASDSSTSSTTTQVGVDAMRFSLVATAPSAPTSVSAVPDNGRATVRWAAATANGSPVTSYTVKASPSGATTTVSGSATSATLTGLTNETAYTFTVTATNAVGAGPASTPTAAVRPSSFSHIVPVTPTRILDTRYGTTTNPVSTALAAGAALTIKVAGASGSPVPAGATAAAVNLTATAPQKAGFLSADSTATTGSSTANFAPGQTVANLLVGRLTSAGTLTIVNHSTGTVQVVADVTGYLTTSGTTQRWVATTPTRLLDTRVGTTSNPVRTALAAGAALTIKVAGVTGSPVPAGATAAAVNLTATAPQKAGFLSADSTATTGSSTANFAPGQTVANLLVGRLTSSGTLTIVNHSSGTVQVVADVTGYVTSTSTANQWASTNPTRLVDTRYGTSTNPVRTALAAGASLTIKVAGVSGSPVPSGAKAAAINLTATAPQQPGFLSADSTATTGSSTANFAPGQTVANLVVGRLTSSGTITVVNHSRGTVQVVADVTGYLR